jgi:FixJ family two-component response regulator
VIFVTGHEDAAAEATVMQAGVFNFLIKPLDDDQFLRAVHRALGHPIREKDETSNESISGTDRR